MKTLTLTTCLAALAALPAVHAQQGTLTFPKPAVSNTPPPSVYVADPPPPPLPVGPTEKKTYVYEQKPTVATRVPLITPEQAQSIIDRFKVAYPKLGSPRMLIFVNRELVDEQSGMKLTHRKEHVESTLNKASGSNQTSTVKSTSENNFRVDEKAQPTLSDKQTVRDIERLFGRPLRTAGATLADQHVAAELIADKPLEDFIGTSDKPQARKDREALLKVADAVIEVLIQQKTVTVPGITSNQTVTIPDIEATAINLKDSRILGQAASSDITGHVPAASLGSYDVREIAEVTALSLMEDMIPQAK